MMNYFEFYNIPESFIIDQAALKIKFYELSKRYHPDFYANEDEAKQQEILELSTVNNKAFQVLSTPSKLIEYILQQHNLLLDGDKHQLDPDFLMEMMDINEALMEVEDNSALNKIKTQLIDIEKQLNDALQAHIAEYEIHNTATLQKALVGIKDIYLRQKYLLRIKDSLNTFAARF